jgi:hypothetical protein
MDYYVKGSIMDKKYYYLLGGILLGIVLGPQIRRLPGVDKIPTF